MRSAAAIACIACLAACGRASTSGTASNPDSGDAAFRSIAKDAIDDFTRRNPSAATDLGIHTCDAQLDDLSQAAVDAASKAFADFRARAAAIDPSTLSPDAQLDREQLIHALDAGILANDSIRMWAKNPDLYSSAITNAAY